MKVVMKVKVRLLSEGYSNSILNLSTSQTKGWGWREGIKREIKNDHRSINQHESVVWEMGANMIKNVLRNHLGRKFCMSQITHNLG